MLATWHWHIEISSKCTLACPRCARQEVPNGLVNTELDLKFFQKNFTPEFIKANVEKITFCGDDGDPIYAHDLIDVIKYFKSVKPVEIVIITNGSHKKTTWWTELGNNLTDIDSVHFSIDGFDNYSNNIYRVNSNYDSIIAGLQTLRATSSCTIVWATIAFKFNEKHIELMQNTARHLGADRFQLTKSTKFGCVYPVYGIDDPLQPSDRYVSSTHRFEREVIEFTNKKDRVLPINIKLYNKYKDQTLVVPLCFIGNKGLYINSQGMLFPCCWVANRYTHNNEWQTIGSKFNLNVISIEQALQDNFWKNNFLKFNWQECKTKCQSALVNQEYATSW